MREYFCVCRGKNKQNITNLLSESVSEGERDFNHRWIKMSLQISPDLHIRLTCKAQQSSKPLSLSFSVSFFLSFLSSLFSSILPECVVLISIRRLLPVPIIHFLLFFPLSFFLSSSPLQIQSVSLCLFSLFPSIHPSFSCSLLLIWMVSVEESVGWYFCSVGHASHTHVQRGPSPALACFCYPERDSVEDERERERERGEGYRGINRGWGEERGSSQSLFFSSVSLISGAWPRTPEHVGHTREGSWEEVAGEVAVCLCTYTS